MRLASLSTDQAGRVKITTILMLLIVAAGVYVGIAYGSIYWYKYKISEAMQQELSFAGQRNNQSIHDHLVQDIAQMNLPPAARNVRLVQIGPPRALRATVSYVDTVNLLVTKKAIRVTVEARRIY